MKCRVKGLGYWFKLYQSSEDERAEEDKGFMEMDKVGVFLTGNISDHLPHLQSGLQTKGAIYKIFLSPFDIIILLMTGGDNNSPVPSFFQDITKVKKISFSTPKRSIKVVNL